MTKENPSQTSTLDYDTESDAAVTTEGEWLEEPEEELPRRPRRKLLAPVPVTLFVVLLLAGAFFAGVEVEKGQTSSSTSGGLPSGLSALRSRLEARGTSSSSATGGTGFPGASGGSGFPTAGGGGFPGARGLAGGGITTGEVSFASGDTLYVTSSEGNTVKVSAAEGATVSKTITTNVHSIHPGDTVIVRGSQNKNGSVSASSITVSSAGGSGTSATGGSSTSGVDATPQLFGAG